jgi:hypothetical protein
MGRPLKIQKYSLATGSTASAYGTPVPVDQAYPPFNALEDSTPPIGSTNSVPWAGVVGGEPNPGTSTTYPITQVTVNIALPDGTGAGDDVGYIIRQKGARKYLVAGSTTVNATALVVGAMYQIATVGDTNFTLCGANPTFQVGDIFTATAVGTGTGTVVLVGICVLSDSATPAPGNMSIGITEVNGSTYASKLTNKYVYDFSGGETGGNANTGDVWDYEQVQNNIRYAANFFADDGYEVKSGTTGQPNTATQQNQLGMALVDNDTTP